MKNHHHRDGFYIPPQGPTDNLPTVDLRNVKLERKDGVPQLVRVGAEYRVTARDLHASADRLIEGLSEDHFPPQGEPGGDPEPELTRAEADERERSSHMHPC